MEKLKIVWTVTAKNQLKAIFDFYKVKSLVGARNVKNDILNATRNIVFLNNINKMKLNLISEE